MFKEVQLVINTSIAEGMSNVIMESMINGVPVLARENEGNLKLIKNGYNGIIFNTKDEFIYELNKFYSDDENIEFKKSLIENGKKSINESFGYNTEVSNYRTLLKEIFHKYYIQFEYKNHRFDLFFPDIIHPFSIENNDIFEVI